MRTKHINKTLEFHLMFKQTAACEQGMDFNNNSGMK